MCGLAEICTIISLGIGTADVGIRGEILYDTVNDVSANVSIRQELKHFGQGTTLYVEAQHTSNPRTSLDRGMELYTIGIQHRF